MNPAQGLLIAAVVMLFATPGTACSFLSLTAETLATPEAVTLGGILNPDTDDTPVFNPSGDTVFFDRAIGPRKTILISHRTNGKWSPPQTAPFSGQWFDQNPALSPDGSFLIFDSDRPIPHSDKPLIQSFFRKPAPGSNLWKVTRKRRGWSRPVWLGAALNDSPFVDFPNIAGDGSLYFIRMDQGAVHTFRSQYRNGKYLSPTRVPLGDPLVSTHDPAVALDGSFIVFDYGKTTTGLGRLSISMKEGDHWGKPQDMGDAVNQDAPWGARLAPDGHTLYFSGNTRIWSLDLAPWISHR